MVRHTQILQTYTGEVYDFSAEFDPYVIDINNRLLDVETYKDRVQRNENFINSYDSRLNTLEAWKTIYPSVVNEQFDRAYDYIRETYWCRTDFLGFSYDMSQGNFIEGHKNNNLILGSTSQHNHAEGFKNKIDSSEYSHIEGFGNTNIANASYSHIEGNSNINQGTYSHLEGGNNISLSKYSHVEGYNNYVIGAYSHVEGLSHNIVDSEDNSKHNLYAGIHVEGYDNTVNFVKTDSHTWGNFSHIEGAYNTANGISNHVEGQHNITNGFLTHVSGYYNIGNDNQHVLGRYNKEITQGSYIIIGNGTNVNDRHNIVEIDISPANKNTNNINITSDVNIAKNLTTSYLNVNNNANIQSANIGGNVYIGCSGITTPSIVANNSVKTKKYEFTNGYSNITNDVIRITDTVCQTTITKDTLTTTNVKVKNIDTNSLSSYILNNTSTINTKDLNSKNIKSDIFESIYSYSYSSYTSVLNNAQKSEGFINNVSEIIELFNEDIAVGKDKNNVYGFDTIGLSIKGGREDNFNGKLKDFPGIYKPAENGDDAKFDYPKLLLLLINYVKYLNNKNNILDKQVTDLTKLVNQKNSEYNNRIALLESEVFDSFIIGEGDTARIIPVSKNNGKIAFIEQQ